jgi:branched-chain amino acid transport system substrate-binding protein
MMKRKALAAALPLMLIAAACGSSKKTETGAATTAKGGATTAAGGAAPADALVISSDLPLQGASADASKDTNLALKQYLASVGGKAGKYNIVLKEYDNATAAKGSWDDATCSKNANDHVSNAKEVAVMGTFNSGCAKIEIPILNQDPKGPMLMISHANTNPGITKKWDPGEPEKYYPKTTRNYGRVVATDDFQGAAGAQYAAKELKVKNCLVLNDAQTYGVGVATAFKAEAPKQNITIAGDEAWDGKAANYTALMEKYKGKVDCVYLGGINDNNGNQLIKDKVTVLGPNNGAVKLIAPDGFSGFPEMLKLPESADMYITFAGLPASELIKAGGAGAKFVTDFKAANGREPASAYAVYGAAALQFIMKAVAASDGTRKDITAKAFSGIKVSKEESLIGKEFSIGPEGDVTVKDMSVQIVKDGKESFVMPWAIGG